MSSSQNELLNNFLNSLNLVIVASYFDKEESFNYRQNRNDNSSDASSQDSSSDDTLEFLYKDSGDSVMKLDHFSLDLQHSDAESCRSSSQEKNQHILFMKQCMDTSKIVFTNLCINIMDHICIRIKEATATRGTLDSSSRSPSMVKSHWSIRIENDMDMYCSKQKVAQMSNSLVEFRMCKKSGDIGYQVAISVKSATKLKFIGWIRHLLTLKRLGLLPSFPGHHAEMTEDSFMGCSTKEEHSFGASSLADSSSESYFDEDGNFVLKRVPTSVSVSLLNVKQVSISVINSSEDPCDENPFTSEQNTLPPHCCLKFENFKLRTKNPGNQILGVRTWFEKLSLAYNTHTVLQVIPEKGESVSSTFNFHYDAGCLSGNLKTPAMHYIWKEDTFKLLQALFHGIFFPQKNPRSGVESFQKPEFCGDNSPQNSSLDRLLREKLDQYNSSLSLHITPSKLHVSFPQASQGSSLFSSLLKFKFVEPSFKIRFDSSSFGFEMDQCKDMFAFCDGLEILHSESPVLRLDKLGKELKDSPSDEPQPLSQHLKQHDILSSSPIQMTLSCKRLTLKMTTEHFDCLREILLRMCRIICGSKHPARSPKSQHASIHENIFRDGKMVPQFAFGATIPSLEWHFLDCGQRISNGALMHHNYILSCSHMQLYSFVTFSPQEIVRLNFFPDDIDHRLVFEEKKANGEKVELLRSARELQKFRGKKRLKLTCILSEEPSVVKSHSVANISLKGVLMRHMQHFAGDLWISNIINYFSSPAPSEYHLNWKKTENLHVKLSDWILQYSPQDDPSNSLLVHIGDAYACALTSTGDPNSISIMGNDITCFLGPGISVKELLRKRGHFSICDDLREMNYTEVVHEDSCYVDLCVAMGDRSKMKIQNTALVAHFTQNRLKNLVDLLRDLLKQPEVVQNPALTPPKKAEMSSLSEAVCSFDITLNRTIGQLTTQSSCHSSVELMPAPIHDPVINNRGDAEEIPGMDGVTIVKYDAFANSTVNEDFLNTLQEEKESNSRAPSDEEQAAQTSITVLWEDINLYIYATEHSDSRYFRSESKNVRFHMTDAPDTSPQVHWLLSLTVQEHKVFDSYMCVVVPVLQSSLKTYDRKYALNLQLKLEKIQNRPMMSVHLDVEPLRLNLQQYHTGMLEKLLQGGEESLFGDWDMEFSRLFVSQLRLNVNYTAQKIEMEGGVVRVVANMTNMRGLQLTLEEVDLQTLRNVQEVVENLCLLYSQSLASCKALEFALGILPLRSLYNVSKSAGDLVRIPLSTYNSEASNKSVIVRGISRGLLRFMRESAKETSNSAAYYAGSCASLLAGGESTGGGTSRRHQKMAPKSVSEGFQQAAETFRDSRMAFREGAEDGEEVGYFVFVSAFANGFSRVLSGLGASLTPAEEDVDD